MAKPDTQTVVRQAARVVLLDPQDRVLLLRCRSGNDDGTHFWITPGGGLDPGESHEDAAARELYEEIGLADTQIGPHIWSREHKFPWLGRVLCQHERFYLCRVGHDIQVKRHQNSREELMYLTGHRWWSAGQVIAAAEEQFAPRRLGMLLHELLTNGTPGRAVDVGV